MSMPYELTRSSSYTAAKDDVLLFETAWEVAKRVGGIYTVLKSKAEATMQEVRRDDRDEHAGFICISVW